MSSSKILACTGGFINERIRSLIHIVNVAVKPIKQAIDGKREHEQSETALQHKSNSQVHRELKPEVEFGEYLKGPFL